MSANFCRECGAQLKPNANFCIACGSPVFQENTVPATPVQEPEKALLPEQPDNTAESGGEITFDMGGQLLGESPRQ